MLCLFKTSQEFDRETGLASISGPTRYFLYRLVSDPDSWGTPVTVTNFVKRYKVNDRVVSKAINELVGCGLIKKEVVQPVSENGRYQYFLDEGFVERLDSVKGEALGRSLEAVVEHVLTAGGDEVGRLGSKWLTPYNRVVLAALLVKSDAAGAVSDVGASDLKRIAGLSADGLRSQLSKLMEQGYIRSRVPGVTGRYLFGLSKGAYFLNLAHPDFLGLGGQVCLLLRVSKYVDELGGFRSAHGMYSQSAVIRQFLTNEAQSIVRLNWARQDRLEPLSAQNAKWFEAAFEIERGLGAPMRLHEWFRDEPRAPFIAYLQMLINRYASQIVNSCLHDGGWDFRDSKNGLIGQIRKDLSAADSLLGENSTVVDAVAYSAIKEALKVWEILISDTEIQKLALSGVRCQIMPLSDPKMTVLYTSILVYGEGLPEQFQNCCWRVEMKPDNRRRRWVQHSKCALGPEGALEEYQAFSFGLRSVGKRYPRAASTD